MKDLENPDTLRMIHAALVFLNDHLETMHRQTVRVSERLAALDAALEKLNAG
jgi:hypothetical protein